MAAARGLTLAHLVHPVVAPGRKERRRGEARRGGRERSERARIRAARRFKQPETTGAKLPVLLYFSLSLYLCVGRESIATSLNFSHSSIARCWSAGRTLSQFRALLPPSSFFALFSPRRAHPLVLERRAGNSCSIGFVVAATTADVTIASVVVVVVGLLAMFFLRTFATTPLSPFLYLLRRRRLLETSCWSAANVNPPSSSSGRLSGDRARS